MGIPIHSKILLLHQRASAAEQVNTVGCRQVHHLRWLLPKMGQNTRARWMIRWSELLFIEPPSSYIKDTDKGHSKVVRNTWFWSPVTISAERVRRTDGKAGLVLRRHILGFVSVWSSATLDRCFSMFSVSFSCSMLWRFFRFWFYGAQVIKA